MSKRKYIYWHQDIRPNDKGEMFANVHLLIGYNQASIADFKKMADELRETFPQATDEEICGGTVSHSSFVKNFTIVTWNAHIPKKDYPDWQQVDNGFVEYYW